ncbi:4a-hydroxytetrahydrobiopterin dehydratase [Bradyrhizobium vignae]|uniref:4a-hydroxytetrahydrobiopterin dehydratase n=1 Tax=Bradyrhizobium vignae TaxID=1549949 RepID=A0A2U3PWB8_9BRAD|nr:4a-hydroxytetrahydrobiopterin dehydratase [Bradyrhizobium vignae]MBP0115226.1 4a-hydroxytetrahydrobiopterin dehydratase [Bradyrhizobium vignae]SPP93462.1 Transcriptional coactivator pterin dehydratase [Bradyrhizobium vignae]
MVPKCDIFISYRRLDSAIFSQWLANQLSAAYGQDSVFIDTQNIRTADVWAEQIEQRLINSSLVLIVIGKAWLSIADEFGRRRIDLQDDWVRREIEVSLSSKKKILPVLIEGATLPAKQALPPSIAPLLDIQARTMDLEGVQRDMAEFVNEVGILLGRKPASVDVAYPFPLLTISPLDEQNLKVLAERLPTWQIVTRADEKGDKTELVRKFEFKSFRDAIHFMNTAARFIDQRDHHPEWTNIWRTVIVRLTTWDIGSKPSMLDVDVAAYLDQLYQAYAPKIRQKDIGDILPPRAVAHS